MMEKIKLSQNLLYFLIFIFTILLGWGFFNFGLSNNIFSNSIEVGITSLSPRGASGGFAIPASCPSFEHFPGECAPDLTVTSVTPSSATPIAGETVFVTGKIQNIGGTNAPASIARWCKSDDAAACLNGTAGSLGEPAVPSLNQGEVFTPPQITYLINPGNNALTLCADAVGNRVSESNESPASNCKAWPYSAFPVIRFELSLYTVNQGDPVTITWDASTEATNCSGLNFTTGGAVSGQTSVSPVTDTTYTVLCTYAKGTFQASASVDVINSTINLIANPTQVRSGKQSTITWSATEVNSCTTTGPGGFSYNTISGSAPSGPLTQQSTFIFTCQNAGGTLSKSATVSIIPSFEEF